MEHEKAVRAEQPHERGREQRVDERLAVKEALLVGIRPGAGPDAASGLRRILGLRALPHARAVRGLFGTAQARGPDESAPVPVVRARGRLVGLS